MSEKVQELREKLDALQQQLQDVEHLDAQTRAMLDELLRLGVVTETEPGWYKILRRDYAPSVDNPDILYRLATVVYNFVDTVDFNISQTDENKRNFGPHYNPPHE